MLSKIKTIIGFKLHDLDGEIGQVKEFYFEDKHWTILYLVADTGSWLSGQQVLISTNALVAINNEESNISINLTKSEIEESPTPEYDEPVSKQLGGRVVDYDKWPMYWVGPFMGYCSYLDQEFESKRDKTKVRKAFNPN